MSLDAKLELDLAISPSRTRQLKLNAGSGLVECFAIFIAKRLERLVIG